MAKAKKTRAKKYDEKLAVKDITFDELITLSANYTRPKKEKAKKPAKRTANKINRYESA